MSETFLTYLITALVVLPALMLYLRSLKKREARATSAAEKGKLYSEGPKAQHPRIDTTDCIGCQICTYVCPEGDVLAMLGGKAVIINGHKCIGHGLCEDACPVGAITLVLAKPSMDASMPYLTPQFETSEENIFIIGELGGLALIKNAVNQGRDCIDTITRRLEPLGAQRAKDGVVDVLIVGAGPAGISASLRAIQNNLTYITIERDTIGGTVAKYPRQKLVMTSPVEFPIYGKFSKLELSKENLLEFWNSVMQRADFRVNTGEAVEDVQRGEDGVFAVTTSKGQHRARAVVLALGRAGIPRKLGVKGEELPKVMYRLIEADHYIKKNILIVGGGDSAIEAAMGLGSQVGNRVTLSYRKDAFSRIKERNALRIRESIQKGKVNVVFNSVPVEIREDVVVLDVNGETREIPNDYVWVFAGGTPPDDFLKKLGLQFGIKDVTLEASQEARQERAERKARS
ncbi:MAG TPA: NAD(P)-binding domain-containing protein [Paludibaculum sp.]|jgi:putative YpdA family bacillithiol system oxidoreductase